ncbi:retrovirus-related pol polyprotein from transposon TNT 1-94 [Tanacetum coccineum]
MQEELLQFKLQDVWTLVDLPNWKRAIGTKWVFRNKKDERGIVIRNKERLVAQGYTQEEGIDYDEVFLYEKIKEEVYVCQPPGFEDPDFLIEYTRLKKHCMDYIKLLELGMKPCQHIINFPDRVYKKLRFTEVKTASTPIETQKPLLKDENGEEVDVHMYRSMIGSLMYLTSSRPDINVLHCVPVLGYSSQSKDSAYVGASLDRKSTTGDEAVYKELDDSLVRAATTASSLEEEILLEDEEDLVRMHPNMGGNSYIDADEVITLVNDDNEIFDVGSSCLAVESKYFVAEQSGNVVEEVVAVIDAASTIPVSAATITDVEITLAQALAELKSAKPKADKVVIQEPEQGTTTTTPTTIIPVPKPPQDKGKGIMIEEPVVEQVKPMKRLEQMRLDEELAFKLQAEEEEEERLAREKAQQIEEANIAWDDVQAKVEADYQLAQRLQAQEQEELTDEEKARLFV